MYINDLSSNFTCFRLHSMAFVCVSMKYMCIVGEPMVLPKVVCLAYSYCVWLLLLRSFPLWLLVNSPIMLSEWMCCICLNISMCKSVCHCCLLLSNPIKTIPPKKKNTRGEHTSIDLYIISILFYVILQEFFYMEPLHFQLINRLTLKLILCI